MFKKMQAVSSAVVLNILKMYREQLAIKEFIAISSFMFGTQDIF